MTTINHECYVSSEVAKLLKEAGFDWKMKTYYDTSIYLDETIIEDELRDYNFMNGNVRFSAPTLDIARRWLREVKHLDVIVNRNSPIHEPQYSWEYEYVIITIDGRVEDVDCYFDEYEQAQEAGIKKALEIILDK